MKRHRIDARLEADDIVKQAHRIANGACTRRSCERGRIARDRSALFDALIRFKLEMILGARP